MSGKFALIIGNTEYIDPGLAQLTAPGRDSDDFARVLKAQEICAFDQVDIVLNQLSTTVIEAIDEFFGQKKPDDLLVLYFSGHGVRDEFGSLYLAFKNTIRSRLRSTAVKSDHIREAMDQSRSKRQVLILDCCNSGAFPQGTKGEVGGTMGMVSALQGYGRFVLTASDATQFAWEGNKVIGETQNSLFTHFLVKGLKGEADSNGDGQISVDELYDYAYEQIARLTPKQTPTKSASRQEGEIILRKITRIEDIKPVPLPAALIDPIGNPLADVRLAAVQQLTKLLNGKNLGLARSAREALERIAAKDDSRGVARAATEALESIRQASQKAEEERKTGEKEERLALEKAEREAKEKETRAIAEKRPQTYLVLLNKATHVMKIYYRRILLFSITVALIVGASMFVPLQLLPLSTSTPHPTNTRIPISTSTLTSASRLASTQTPACQIPTAFVKTNNAYLRDGPDVRFSANNHYRNGDQFTVLGRYQDWFQAEFPDGNKGWLYKDWLTFPSDIDTSNICLIPVEELPPTPQNNQQNLQNGADCVPTYYVSCP